jgi:hypothetical protein
MSQQKLIQIVNVIYILKALKTLWLKTFSHFLPGKVQADTRFKIKKKLSEIFAEYCIEKVLLGAHVNLALNQIYTTDQSYETFQTLWLC